MEGPLPGDALGRPRRLEAALWLLLAALLAAGGWPEQLWAAWRAWHPALAPEFALRIGAETLKFLVAAGALAYWLLRRGLARSMDAKALLSLALLLGPLLALPLLAKHFSAVFGGLRYFWLEDDAMVSMRYAKNLAEGRGLAWNPGERVEGYSDFLWMLGMAWVHWLGAGARTASAWVQAFNLLLFSACALSSFRLARALGASPAASGWSALAAAASYDLLKAATSGLETLLVAWLFSEAIVLLLRRAEGAKLPWEPFALAGLLALARADGALLSLAVLGWALLVRAERRGWLAAALLALGPALAYQAFRVSYFGDWLPNTARLKSGHWEGRYAAGFLYTWGFFVLQHPSASALAAYSLLKSGAEAQGRKAACLLTLLAVSAYACWTGGDQYDFKRFLLPLLPLLLALAARGASALPLAPALAGLLLFAGTESALRHYPWLSANLGGGGKERVELALKLKEIAQPGESLAAMLAGSAFYFSELKGVDLLGRCDAAVARLAPHPGLGLPGHNKFDLEASFKRGRPDYVYAEVSGDPASPFYERLLAGSPAFTGRCGPEPLLEGTVGAVYGCQKERRGPGSSGTPPF